MRISDWSSDVCSSDLWPLRTRRPINLDSSSAIRRAGDGDGALLGETIVFTGALVLPRRDAADRAHALGAAVEPGVTKKTTMLVVGDQDLSKLAGHQKSSKQIGRASCRERGCQYV